MSTQMRRRPLNSTMYRSPSFSPALLAAAIHQVTPRGMLATPRLNAPEVSKFAMVPGVPDVVYKHGMIYAVDRCGTRNYNSFVSFVLHEVFV